MKKNTLGQSILELKNRTGLKPAIRFCENGHWQDWSWHQYSEQIYIVSSALLELKTKPGDKIAICSSTRLQWALMDLGVLSIQGITVPIYPNNTPEEIEFILNHSEATVLVLETRSHLKTWYQISSKCPQVKQVVLLDATPETDSKIGMQTWNQFLELGKSKVDQHQDRIEKLLSDLKLTDVATLVYTSGTTGAAKAAVLTHEQVISEITEAFPMCGANPADTSLTFLPFAHILGRIEIWAHCFIGYTMAYAENLDRIRANLLEVKPTFMMAVPRIFEKIYSAIWAQLEMSPISRRLFKWALDVGIEVSNKKLHRQNLSVPLVLEYELARKLVLHKVTDAFGGQIRFVISGGAPINREISQFFHASGVLILEGYGLTETTAAICVNTPYNYRFGSVGRPIGDVELKIADDGEILVRSKKVMIEYYKDPASTKEAFTEDWFHTGDIGEILDSGDLRITDRKKDLIKTAGGKYVAPQKLEGLLKLNPLISHALIHGDQKKYIVALLTLNQNYVKQLAEEKSIKYQVWTDLVSRPEITDLIRKAVADTNAQLASYETIKKFTILPDDFTVENGELTPSLKVKRKLLDKKLSSQIQALYS